jgi:hypothetical protein
MKNNKIPLIFLFTGMFLGSIAWLYTADAVWERIISIVGSIASIVGVSLNFNEIKKNRLKISGDNNISSQFSSKNGGENDAEILGKGNKNEQRIE